MTNIKQQKRATALLEWAAVAAADGHDVPTEEQLAAIAANPEAVGTLAAEGAALAWKATIEHILHQVKFGLDPYAVVQNLPRELFTPAEIAAPARRKREPVSVASGTDAGSSQSGDGNPTAPAAESHSAATVTADPVEALMQWRSQRIADGVESAGAIKDATLIKLVKYRFVSEDQIRNKLQGADPALAAEIAVILAEFFPDEATASEGAGSKPQAASAVTTPQAATERPTPVTAVPAPTALPAATTDAEPDAIGPVPDRGLGLAHNDFCEFEYGESPVEPGAVTIVKVSEGHRLTWEPYLASPDDTVIYRVVSTEDQFPHKPEAGELLVATTDIEFEDTRFLASAVRTFQVWCHVGADVRTARYQQPVLVAQGEVVSPVADFNLFEDEGRVIAQWNVFPGTRAVRVFRVPLREGGRGLNDPRHQILATDHNLNGFVDTEVTRGERYLYRAFAEVAVGNGVRLASPAQKDIAVSVVLQPVTDLQITLSPDRLGEFELRWSTPQAGRVVIYRSPTPPSADLELSEMPQEALAPQGLDDASQLKHPVVAADSVSSRMTAVPWPGVWDRAYFTPVTILADHAKVGKVRVQTRPLPAVTDARIIERFDAQIVSFGWPTGAASVLAFVAPRTVPAEQAIAGHPDEEVHLRHHRRDGGLTLSNKLPAGCIVYLVPVAYSGGEQVRGEHTGISYPGLARITYSLPDVHVDAAGRVVAISLESDTDLDAPPPFVMVHNASRFPLGPYDGVTVPLMSPHTQQQAWQLNVGRLMKSQPENGWRALLPNQPGYVRLFADTRGMAASADDSGFPVRRIAVADPPLATLRLDVPVGPAL